MLHSRTVSDISVSLLSPSQLENYKVLIYSGQNDIILGPNDAVFWRHALLNVFVHILHGNTHTHTHHPASPLGPTLTEDSLRTIPWSGQQQYLVGTLKRRRIQLLHTLACTHSHALTHAHTPPQPPPTCSRRPQRSACGPPKAEIW